MSIVQRYSNNPILTKEDIPYKVSTVHNAGITKYKEKTIMLFRSHLPNGRSVIGIAESKDGYQFSVREKPFLTPATEEPFKTYEEFGVEDPRISYIENEGYYITYSGYSRFGVRIMLAKTIDFQTIERIAAISQADMRNVVLFPQKFGDHYIRLDRPHSEISPWSIWISYSKDLIHWGRSQVIMRPETYHWDEMKIGPGATPIRTDKGWLHIYHGVFPTMDGSVYRLGAALHDLEDPSKILGVSDEWILEPEDPWERVGYVHNVVFTCGAVKENKNTIRLYWGAADTVMCAGTLNIDELTDLCLNHSRPALGS